MLLLLLPVWLGRSRQRKIKLFFSHELILPTQVNENRNPSSTQDLVPIFWVLSGPSFGTKGLNSTRVPPLN